MTSDELFKSGYAIAVYNIINDIQTFKHFDRYYETKRGTVPMTGIDGWWNPVAKISDVKVACNG